MSDLLANVAVGAITGLGYAVIGFAGAVRKDPKSAFDPGRALSSLAAGALAGAAFAFSGVTFDAGTISLYVEIAAAGGLVAALKQIAKIVNP